MSKEKKVGVAFDNASHVLHVEARKRRLAAHNLWKRGKTYREIGETFGVTRQRAFTMVRKAMQE